MVHGVNDPTVVRRLPTRRQSATVAGEFGSAAHRFRRNMVRDSIPLSAPSPVPEVYMEEFWRHPYWCPRGHPEGVRRLDVFFEYCAFPVWGQGMRPATGDQPAQAVYGMIRPELLGISSRLTEDLQAWADWTGRHSAYGGGQSVSGGARTAHLAQGQELADRLAEETGAVVICDKSLRRDNPPDCPHCGTGRRC